MLRFISIIYELFFNPQLLVGGLSQLIADFDCNRDSRSNAKVC
jgi:hypothetical protein